MSIKSIGKCVCQEKTYYDYVFMKKLTMNYHRNGECVCTLKENIPEKKSNKENVFHQRCFQRNLSISTRSQKYKMYPGQYFEFSGILFQVGVFIESLMDIGFENCVKLQRNKYVQLLFTKEKVATAMFKTEAFLVNLSINFFRGVGLLVNVVVHLFSFSFYSPPTD